MPSWLDWNNAIGEAVFSPDHAGRAVYLAIDREEIAAIGAQFGLKPVESYDDFRDVMRRQIRWGWSSARVQQKYPACLAELAVQVLAAFDMRDDEESSSKAYWIRLREFLGEPLEGKMPRRLRGEWHLAMWSGLARWANVTNAGKRGRITLANRDGGSRFVAEPMGQCLLRRADLTRLQCLFFDYDPGKRGSYQGRWLRGLVEDALHSLSNKYFHSHGRRVLKDPHRAVAAWAQVEAEYGRYLNPLPTAANEPRLVVVHVASPAQAQPRPRVTLLLQVGRAGLSGGLYGKRDGRLVQRDANLGAALRRCLRAGSDDLNGRSIMTTRLDGAGSSFRKRRRCRVGDEILLLIPEEDEPAWPDAQDLFATGPVRYHTTAKRERPGWRALDGLPSSWIALRGRIRDDLDGVDLPGPWASSVDRQAASLRLTGGLLLRRGAWMLGAGPTVRVVGPGRFNHVLVDGETLPLDAAQTATLNLAVGDHTVCLPARASGTALFGVEQPERAKTYDTVGWHRVVDGWPASTAERRRLALAAGGATLHGPVLVGDWPPHQSPSPPELPRPTLPIELIALALVRHVRLGVRPSPGRIDRVVDAARDSKHPLARALAHAAAHSPLG